MGKSDDDAAGVNTPESAVLTGISNVFKLIFVSAVLALLWLVAVGIAAYFSYDAATGSFAQSLAINVLAALLLVVVAPILFSMTLRRPQSQVLIVAAAVAFLWLGSIADGGMRGFLLNIGTGLGLILAIDFNIVHRFKGWRGKLEGRAREAAENIHLVL